MLTVVPSRVTDQMILGDILYYSLLLGYFKWLLGYPPPPSKDSVDRRDAVSRCLYLNIAVGLHQTGSGLCVCGVCACTL